MLTRHILPRLAGYKVSEVGHKDIQTLHNSLKSTPYHANRTIALVSKMFELSIKWGWRSDNPAKGIERFHEEKRHRWLSDEELTRLIAALDAHPNFRAANAIRLQLLTGARIGEVLTSKWTDFDLDRGVWVKPSHHTKQKRTEHLPISGAACELLVSMRVSNEDQSNLVFPGKNKNKPIVDLKKFWSAIMTAADIHDYRIHDNRHTHASYLVSNGVSLAIVGRLLGHTNPTTTTRYAHLADQPLRDAANTVSSKMNVLGSSDP
jgi:integrase